MLSRTWHDSGPRALWMMLNSSRADGERDDTTISKCIGFSRDLGLAGFDVVNLFAFRTPHPLDLLRQADPVGPENNHHIMLATLCNPYVVICAWGASHRLLHKLIERRRFEVFCILRKHAPQPLRFMSFGKTSDGSPRHPSRLAYSTALEAFA